MVRDLNLHATQNGKAGFLHAIAKTGRNLDEMRELLEEYGYLQPGSSIEDMYAKIEAATRGQQSYSDQREYQEDEAYPFDLEGISKKSSKMLYLYLMKKSRRQIFKGVCMQLTDYHKEQNRLGLLANLRQRLVSPQEAMEQTDRLMSQAGQTARQSANSGVLSSQTKSES